ncbi:LEA type 2 family protein [Nitrosopumilus ureiphilus]|uniref:Uncharacterized protein n=1 Tax=Nitrosopumilus ureiphilus TaxID=1470067 RepID=A0A7D5R0U7_9ARCH|nr:LEA type 2 family protein [Nitrosopumilus ureiphilus]QLH06076.1 hypothetical protein C5F50_02525 [Nitrosopumilus ureiphilus]
MGKLVAIGIIILAIFLIILGLFAYSYTQLSVNLHDVRLHSIDWAPLSWDKLLNLGLSTLTGEWFGTAFMLIEGVNLNLLFGISNNGVLPVYIPDLSYDILINGILIGQGFSDVDLAINPGQTKVITSFQNVNKDSMTPAVFSIIESQGVMEIKVKGIAYFQFFGIGIPVPFESTRNISIYDEVRERINEEIQKNKLQNSVMYSVGKSIESVLGSIVNDLFGGDELEISLSGQKFVDSIYQVSPGTYAHIAFSLLCESQVEGGFIANDILGDDIIVLVLDDMNFEKFENDQYFTSFYDSGKVKSGAFDLTLESGDYSIVMSNQYSMISTKTVQFQAVSLCV